MVENSRQRPVEPTRDGASPPTPTPDHAGDLPSDGRDQQTPGTFLASGQEHLGTMLDTGSFTQLFTAAQQSGLLANADAIISVRDCEFRAARWQKAFDMINGLYIQLTAQASRRQGELRREERAYKSGTLKMTPKEWMRRQRRVTEQTQKTERARRQFALVLDGLTALRAAKHH